MQIRIYSLVLWNLISGMKDKGKFYSFIINGDILSGPRYRLIELLDNKGYNALDKDKNPHEYWQFSEYLRRK